MKVDIADEYEITKCRVYNLQRTRESSKRKTDEKGVAEIQTTIRKVYV